MRKSKDETITLKVDDSLLEAMEGIANRSEFIRGAILTALGRACPLCKGTGTLTPNQKKHWDALLADHTIKKCTDCHEVVLVCDHGTRKNLHAKKAK